MVDEKTGRAYALKMAKCTMKEGMPEKIEGAEFEIEADLIVAAIGQSGVLDGLEEFNNGKNLIDADKNIAPGKPGHFVCGDIIRPHLLTTAIGQGSIAAETIDQYLGKTDLKELKKRPKVDVHHFNLLEKLKESGLKPADYEPGAHWGTDELDFSVHNYEDRSGQEIINTDKMHLAHFPYTPRNVRDDVGPDSDSILGNFDED